MEQQVLPFDTTKETGTGFKVAADNVNQILIMARSLLLRTDCDKIGVVLSANLGQHQSAVALYNDFEADGEPTGVCGANQAAVFAQMETLLKGSDFSDISKRVYWIPIPTMKYVRTCCYFLSRQGLSSKEQESALNLYHAFKVLDKTKIVVMAPNKNPGIGGGVARGLYATGSNFIEYILIAL